MFRSISARTVANLGMASALALFLGACGSFSLPSLSSSPEPAPEPGAGPEMPASIRADEIVGRWGLASYQNPADRARTEAAAKAQCKQPYVIGAGTSGAVAATFTFCQPPKYFSATENASSGVMSPAKPSSV